MKGRSFYTRDPVKYVVCFLVIVCICLFHSLMVAAQVGWPDYQPLDPGFSPPYNLFDYENAIQYYPKPDYNFMIVPGFIRPIPPWDNTQLGVLPDFTAIPDAYQWNNSFGNTSESLLPSAQGRGGIQSLAPEGVQVLSARNIHTLYTFWTQVAQNTYGYEDTYLSGFGTGRKKSQNSKGTTTPLPIVGKPVIFPIFGNVNLNPSAAIGYPFPITRDVYQHPTYSASSLPLFGQVYLSPSLGFSNMMMGSMAYDMAAGKF